MTIIPDYTVENRTKFLQSTNFPKLFLSTFFLVAFLWSFVLRLDSISYSILYPIWREYQILCVWLCVCVFVCWCVCVCVCVCLFPVFYSTLDPIWGEYQISLSVCVRVCLFVGLCISSDSCTIFDLRYKWTHQAQIRWRDRGYPHHNPPKNSIMIFFTIKTQARINE